MKEGITKAAWDAVRRFPAVFLVVLVAAFQLMALPSGNVEDWRLLAALSLCLPLTISFHLFVENSSPDRSRARTIVLGALVFLPLALYGLALPASPEGAPGYVLHRHFVLLIGLHLLVSFAPFLIARNREKFWAFNKTLFLRFLATVLFSGTLYVGLTLILGGIGALFGAGEAFYFALRWHLAVVIFLVFNTWFFLAGVPRLWESSPPAEYPRVLKNFCQYVLCPLILVYAAVLLLLVTKGLLQGQGQDSPESLSFAPLAVFGILAYLLIHPLDGTARWVSLFRRIFFALLIPFVALQFYALIESVRSGGLEEATYYLFVLSVWVGIASLYFLLSSKPNILLWIPVSLALIAFLSVAGPWSAYSVSKRSQLSRLESVGRDILPLDLKNASKAVNALPADRAAEFSSQAEKISGFYGVRALAPIFREPLPDGSSWRQIFQGEEPAAPGPKSQGASALGISFYSHGSEDVVDIKGFDHYYREVQVVGPSQGPQDCSFELCAKLLEGENRILLFDRKGERTRVDAAPFLKKLVDSKKLEIEKQSSDPENAGASAYFEVQPKDLVFDFAANSQGRPVKGRLLFWTVFLEKKDAALRLKSFQTMVLLTE